MSEVSKTPEQRAREIIEPRIGQLMSGPEFKENLIRDIAQALKEAAALPPRPTQEEISDSSLKAWNENPSIDDDSFIVGALWAFSRIYGEEK